MTKHLLRVSSCLSKKTLFRINFKYVFREVPIIAVFFEKKKSNAAKPLRFLIAAYRRRNQILFFAMPRTSSGSIGEVLAKHGIKIHGHRRRPGYKFLRDRDDCKNVQIVSVVRHPYSRFLSAYFALEYWWI